MKKDIFASARCNCGAVNITVSSEPVIQLVCHCHDCQQFSGLEFVEAAFFRRDACLISGETVAEKEKGGSGEDKVNHSCASCSTPMYVEVTVLNGAIALLADKLSPLRFEPLIHVWTSHKAPGVAIPEDIPQSPGRPGDEIVRVMLDGFF